MSMAVSNFIEYTIGVGAVSFAPPYKDYLGSEKMKSEKELFGLAQMYVGLEDEYRKASEYNLHELDEIKKGLENIRDTLFQKGYDIDKFLHYQHLYRTMTVGEYVKFIKTLE